MEVKWNACEGCVGRMWRRSVTCACRQNGKIRRATLARCILCAPHGQTRPTPVEPPTHTHPRAPRLVLRSPASVNGGGAFCPQSPPASRHSLRCGVARFAPCAPDCAAYLFHATYAPCSSASPTAAYCCGASSRYRGHLALEQARVQLDTLRRALDRLPHRHHRRVAAREIPSAPL